MNETIEDRIAAIRSTVYYDIMPTCIVLGHLAVTGAPLTAKESITHQYPVPPSRTYRM